jgi:hypothetical protein
MIVRRAAFLLSSLGVGTAGCSLLISLDGLTNGTSASAADADAGAADATNDGGPVEAGMVDDGATADGGDAGFDPLCTGAVFCDRFERASAQGPWPGLFLNAGGTIDLDTSTFTSPVKSLVIHVPTAGDARVGLGSNDYPNVAHVRVAFAMKTALPSRNMALFRIQLAVTGANRVLDLYMRTNGFVLEEQGFFDGGTSIDYPVAAGFKPDEWQRWTMELDATVSAPLGVLTLDGVEQVRARLSSGFVRGTLNVIVGSFYAPTGPARDVWYDDVSITLLP